MAKSYSLHHHIDYDEMFVSVAKMTTFYVMFVVVAAKGWHLHQMDMKKHLQGDNKEQVCMV